MINSSFIMWHAITIIYSRDRNAESKNKISKY